MEHWIGIDVSSATLDFALLDEKGTHLESAQVDNERKTVMKLMGAWRKRYGVMPERSLICMEATGHYTLMLLNMVVAQQWRAWLAHPNDILQSMGIKRVKNDKVDALRIAQYARTFHEKARLFTAQNLKLDRLKHLITRRKHLVRSRARHRTHITDLNRYMDRQVRIEFDRMDERQIKLEDKLVAHVDDLILDEIKADPQTQRQYDLLRTIPGVGPQLAAYLVAFTDGFARFNTPRQLSCHAGVAPFERSSGSSVRGRTQVSHQADKSLKTLLHMSALVSVREPGELRQYYERKRAEGKKPILVVNAVRNKLVHRICAVIRNNKPYEVRTVAAN
ncbi:MAG: IS110 family transposase [Flavobacteriales bacterium]|nr:IS110 family transposase [Flavobacteriales bacterium]